MYLVYFSPAVYSDLFRLTPTRRRKRVCVCVRLFAGGYSCFRSVHFNSQRERNRKWQLNRRMSEFSPSRFTSLLLAYSRYFLSLSRTHCETIPCLAKFFKRSKNAQILGENNSKLFSEAKKNIFSPIEIRNLELFFRLAKHKLFLTECAENIFQNKLIFEIWPNKL